MDASSPPLDVPVRPWDYNPSGWRRRIAICLLATVAFLIATGMALYQWRLIGWVWDPVFGEQTQQVLDSDVSEMLRRRFLIPDAALGGLVYLFDVVLGLTGSIRRWQYRPWMVFLFGVFVIPMGVVGVVLVAAQGAVVGAWCFPCIVTAMISLALIWLAYNEVWSSLLYLQAVRRKGGPVLKAFFGMPSQEAREAGLEMTGRA